MNHYFGNLHSHTAYSDGTGTPDAAFKWARDTAGLDFYAVTDHSGDLTPEEWLDTGAQADRYCQPGRFVALRGFEWTHWPSGHINVYGSEDYTDINLSPTLQAIYEWIDVRDCLAQFNHPARFESFFDDFEYREALADNFCLYEAGNGPTGVNDGVHYERFPYALDKGWKLVPTDNLDNHSLYDYGHRTVIISPALTREDLLAALRERRVYASDDPDMKVIFKYGEHWMGSVAARAGGQARFDVSVEDDEDIASLELITAGGEVAARRDFAPGEDSRSVAWSPTVQLDRDTYFYLRVVERDENGDDDALSGEQVAVTAPIWLETRGVRWYLAEGCTSGGFETWVLVQNPSASPAQVALTFMTENGEVPGPTATLPPTSRLSWNAGAYVDSYHVSTRVEASLPVVAERAVYWNGRDGGHDSIGVTTPGKTWYLAEGCTSGGFETWVLVQNPSASPAQVALTFMTENGEVPGPTATLPPTSRLSWNAGAYVDSYHVSTRVEASLPVVAERAVYWNGRKEGHDSIGWPGS